MIRPRIRFPSRRWGSRRFLPVAHAHKAGRVGYTGFVRRAAAVAAMLLLAGCGVLQPAAPYDPEIARTVSEFDKAVQRFIGDMQGLSRTPKGTYGENVAFYTKWKAELGHLRNRAAATDVGTSCGPDEEFDTIVAGGFKAFDELLKKGEEAVRSVDTGALVSARQWAERKLEEAKRRLNAAGAAQADYARLEAKVDGWITAVNRIRGAIARASSTAPSTFTPASGGCTSRMVTYLAEQFEALERFHIKQQDIGIPPRRAPPILMSVPVQVILKVQERKKVLSERGLL